MNAGRIDMHRILRLAATAALVVATACPKQDEPTTTATTPDVLLSPDQVALVTTRQIQTGPALSGSLQAETQATVRAEIGGAVLRTNVDAGQPVTAGQELLRIDESSTRDAVASAQSGVTMAHNSVQIAQKEVERADVLSKAGAIPDRQLEQAKNILVGAQAQEADAKTRLSSAQKLWEKTIVKAPWAGIVSERSVSGGDIVAPGAALYTIINPSTMRLEGSVPSDALGSIRIGAPVQFTVNGYPQRAFIGHISAINPTVDPATRQVRVIVTLPNAGGRLVAGLFAEGRVTAESRTAPVVPAEAVDESGVRPWVLRLKNGKTQKVEVDLGIRDAADETIEIRNGLAPGDTVLLGVARGTSDSVKVKVTAVRDSTMVEKR